LRQQNYNLFFKKKIFYLNRQKNKSRIILKNIILKKQIITIFAQLNKPSLEPAKARLQILNNIKNEI
jgi:hypothetical protein